MPTRRVVTRSPHRSVGIISCTWLQDEPIEYESQLERRFLQRALTFPYIRSIHHQPFTFEYEDQGKSLRYTPDFLCTLQDGSRIVVEVKPDVFVKKHLSKITIGKEKAAAAGMIFIVATDREIDDGNAVENAALILRYTRGGIRNCAFDLCEEAIKTSGSIRLQELLTKTNISMGDALHYIGRGKFIIPSLNQIDDNVLITLSTKEANNVSFLFFNWVGATPWGTTVGVPTPAG